MKVVILCGGKGTRLRETELRPKPMVPDPKAVHEASLLNLTTDKAFHLLAWQPVWNFEETIAKTIAWYRGSGIESASRTRDQIAAYSSAARDAGISWAR